MVTEETIGEFRTVIQEEYGVTITEVDAKNILLNTVAYFDLLAKIDHRNQSQTS